MVLMDVGLSCNVLERDADFFSCMQKPFNLQMVLWKVVWSIPITHLQWLALQLLLAQTEPNDLAKCGLIGENKPQGRMRPVAAWSLIVGLNGTILKPRMVYTHLV